MGKLSPDQARILAAAVIDGSFRVTADKDMVKCRALNARGLLSRDAKEAALWFPTEAGRTVARGAAAENGEKTPPQPSPQVGGSASVVAVRAGADASDLAATVERARALLDAGDVKKARILAAGAYAQAKAEGGFAARFGAAEALVAKARRLQADALLIETRAKIAISEHWDEAQAEGLVASAAKGGRPKTVPDGNGLLAADTGLSRKEIHEARKLAAAEAVTPGIVERAIAARLAAGLEPSRASVGHAIGTRTATKAERGDNLYETPPEAVHALLALEDFGPCIWEPACGRGAISRLLEEAGHAVFLSDLNDYGTADRDGELQRVVDFRETAADFWGAGSDFDIVTNPPYGGVMNSFIAHALKVHRPRKMALLLNFNAYCGFEDPDRVFIMQTCPPARIHAFVQRLPMMHREGWAGKIATSQMNTAWFVWERNAAGDYGRQTILSRADWAAHVAGAAESEAA